MAYVSAYCCHYKLLTKFINFVHGYSKHQKIIVDKRAKRKKPKHMNSYLLKWRRRFLLTSVVFRFRFCKPESLSYAESVRWTKGQILFQVAAAKLSQNFCSVEQHLWKELWSHGILIFTWIKIPQNLLHISICKDGSISSY